MTNTYVLTNTINTPDSDTFELTNGGDSIYVAPNVVVADEDPLTSGTFAIRFDSFGMAQIEGAVVGAQALVFGGEVGDTSTVQIGAAGSVTSTAARVAAFGAVTVQTGKYEISNAGLIEAYSDGVDLDLSAPTNILGSGGGTLTNSGTIDSSNAFGVFNDDTNTADNDTLVNTGTISSEYGVAVFDTGGHAETIENSGKIVGQIVGAVSVETVDNSGTIDGLVQFNDPGSSLTDSGAINGGVQATDDSVGATDVTVTATGVITGAPGDDTVSVVGGYDIVNDGKIVATQSAAGGSTNAVVAVSGAGTLENRGTIDGEYNGFLNGDSTSTDVAILDNYGSITGGATAVQDTGGHSAFVNNYGEISGGQNAYYADSNTVVALTNAGTMNGAVHLRDGGSSLANSGEINGVVSLEGAYRVINNGTIDSSVSAFGDGDGVELDQNFYGAGTLINRGKIDAATNGVAAFDGASTDVETLINYGSISAGEDAVHEVSGHQATVFNYGELDAGGGFCAVYGDSSTLVTLHNAGTINGAVNLSGLGSSLADSGAINGDVSLAGASAGATDVVISKTGVLTGNPGDSTLTIAAGDYDIVNAGEIDATQNSGGSSGEAVLVDGAGSIVNSGTIASTNIAISNNAASGTATLINTGTIKGVNGAIVDTGGHLAKIVNSGTIVNTVPVNQAITTDGSTNASLTNSGTITGGVDFGAQALVFNSGEIDAVYALGASSTIDNTGTIGLASDDNIAVAFFAGGAHFTNKGAVNGGVQFAGTGNVYYGVGGTVTGTITGAGADGVYYAGDGVETFDFTSDGAKYARGGTGDDTFRFGAMLTAATTVLGGAGFDTVELDGNYTGAKALTLGAQTLRNIQELQLDAGFSYAITANALTVASGQTLTVDASALAAADDVSFNASNAFAGAYDLIGGAGADTFTFTASNLTAADTVTGGAGFNTLAFSTAGTIAAGDFANVTGIERIVLANGTNNIVLTDAMFAAANGSSLTVDGGASGNNTVSAAGDTSASKGKTLVYQAGAGTDSFTGGFENDGVHVSAAAVGGDTLTGGSGANILTLSTAGSVNLGGVSKFGTINLAAGNSTVTVTDATLAGGSVLLHDGASGNNTVSAAGDTSASTGKMLVYQAGAGTDSFTGGFENDGVHVSAAAVGGDTLTGGSGANILTLSTAGSVNLGGVSKFGTINLAAGNSTVTVTDTTLAGGSVSLHDGASGNNTVSAAGDTSASTGKTLVYQAGAGTDSFTGGFENDGVHVSAAAVGGDTLTGGSGANILTLSTAGSVNLGGVSKFGTINLAAGNSTVTVTDTTLAGGSVSLLDGASGNNTVSAAGDTSASKGKTLVYQAGAGTDSFTGGFENDGVHVSAAAVGGDTLTGGSGANILTLSTAGSVNLGGVSKFGTINLAAGNSTVTVTDTTLAGGSVSLHDGASGNNTVSAAGDTSASTGKTLVYQAGAGTDSFTGGFENDGVHVSAAAVGGDTLTGGSGANTLTLSTAGSVNLGGVSKFGTINLAAGNSTVTVTDTTLAGGSVSLLDGASGNNTVSAAGDTSASKGKTLVYQAGAGTDSFTGGFENDGVHVSAAAVGGDTLTGGSGANILTLSTAGSVNLGGVSKFGTINLAAGNSTVTVTDTTLAGGSVSLHDGASGNNTVSAAGDTSASTGKTLVYQAGAGTDSFTGGFENDWVYAGAGAGTYTAGSGGDNFVFRQDNFAAQTIDDYQVANDKFDFFGVHQANGFDLGATDNALNPTAITAIDPSIFTATAAGGFSSTSQRFAYDTTTGQLFYGADGSGGASTVIAVLAGAPALTASNLFFQH